MKPNKRGNSNSLARTEESIIIDQELSKEIKDILLETKTFSNSGLYSHRIDELINDLETVTDKNKYEVDNFLNQQ